MALKRGRTGRTGREGPEGPEGPDGPIGPMGPSSSLYTKPIKIAFVCVTILFFVTLAGFGKVIRDIQNQRLHSCESTYDGIHHVFEVFFAKDPTPKQKRDIDKFKRRIQELKNQCNEQTGVKK